MTFFQDKKIIVTGATRGIGKTIANCFLDAGATVIGIYAGNRDAAEQFLAEASGKVQNLSLYQCDISDKEQVKSFYEAIEHRFQFIDILINNAGIRKDAIVALMKEEEWQQVIDINLTGTFLMSKHAVPLMMQQKFGRIINITSPMSYLGFAGQANYAASKAGQIGLTKSLSKETAKKKITVNCVSPGFIDTDLIKDLSKEQLAAYKKLIPMKRFGNPEDVAEAVIFLASDKASYITGAVIEITGGL